MKVYSKYYIANSQILISSCNIHRSFAKGRSGNKFLHYFPSMSRLQKVAQLWTYSGNSFLRQAHDGWNTCGRRFQIVNSGTEVNISPKISISAQPLKMALYRNPAMHGSRMVIFLHDSKKALFSTIKSSFSAQFKRKLAKLARYHIIHCIAFYFVI